MSEPGGAPSPYDPPSDDAAGAYGQPHGQAQYGQQYGQPQSGQQYGQPQSGQQYGQPQYGQPQYGPPAQQFGTYGGPVADGPPAYGSPTYPTYGAYGTEPNPYVVQAATPGRGLAIGALATSLGGFLFPIAFVVGLILGIVALTRLRGGADGRGMALAGTIVGGVGILGYVALIFFVFIAASSSTYSTTY